MRYLTPTAPGGDRTWPRLLEPVLNTPGEGDPEDPTPPSAFVTRDSSTGHLMLDGERYRFSGSNVFQDVGLLDAANGNAYGGTVVSGYYLATHSQIDALLTSAVAQDALVLRPFGAVMSRGTANSLQPTLGTFNSAALENVDYFLQQCAIKGIKVVLPLTDEYDFATTSGRVWYAAQTGGGAESNFYTRPATIAAFKAQISYVLDHVNQYTDIAYKDDPTILCWETGNELTLAGASASDFSAWTGDIADYIKVTKGAQQLVMDGGLGITGDGVTYPAGRLALANVDIYSNHLYDNYRTPPWVLGEAQACKAAHKAFVIGEYSWTDKQVNGTGLSYTLGQLMETVEFGSEIDGDLYFMLCAPSTIWGGGFTLHEPADLTFQGPTLIEAQTRSAQLIAHALVMQSPIPTEALNDTLTGTNGDTLDAHTADTGSTWSKQAGSVGVGTIQTNRVWFGAAEANYVASRQPTDADYDVTASIRVVSAVHAAATGVCGRMTLSSKTMYQTFLYYFSGNWFVYLRKWINGSFADLGGGPVLITAPTAGSDHDLTLRMVGNQITVLWDAVSVIGPVTDSSITATGRPGLIGNGASSTTGAHVSTITVA